MKLCEACRELNRVRRLFPHVPKLRKKKVCLWLCYAVSSPRERFWYEDWRCGMHLLQRFKFAYCHRLSDLPERCDLQGISGSPKCTKQET